MRATLTESQLTALYRDTIDSLYGYVSRRCGGERAVAEDITQETWLRAVREWRRTGPPESPIAWLTTVARNLTLNLLRRNEPLALDDTSIAAVVAALEVDAVGDSTETARIVNEALRAIPAEEAQLLEQFHFERLRVAQLAERYGLTERAIEGRLRRARERLRHQIEPRLMNANGGLT